MTLSSELVDSYKGYLDFYVSSLNVGKYYKSQLYVQALGKTYYYHHNLITEFLHKVLKD